MSEPSPNVPRRTIIAIAIASGAVTIAIATTMGAITGYIGHRSAPAVAEAQPPLAEPAPPPTTVLVPIQPAPSATAAPESQALPPSAIDDSLLTYTADPPRFAHEDHDDLERGHHHHDHDRDDRDEEGDDD